MLFNALAYAEAQTGDSQNARKHAESAMKWNRTDADRQTTDNILRYLDSRAAAETREQRENAPHENAPIAADDASGSAPPVLRRKDAGASPPPAIPREPVHRIEGLAQSVDCTGKGARLVVLSEGKLITFDIPDPERVRLTHNGAATFNFTCGPQKSFHIAVEYLPAAKLDGKIAGSVIKLEF